MPKIVKSVSQPKPVSRFKAEFRLQSGPYDVGVVYDGAFKIGEFIFIRSDQSRDFISLLRNAGVDLTHDDWQPVRGT